MPPISQVMGCSHCSRLGPDGYGLLFKAVARGGSQAGGQECCQTTGEPRSRRCAAEPGTAPAGDIPKVT